MNHNMIMIITFTISDGFIHNIFKFIKMHVLDVQGFTITLIPEAIAISFTDFLVVINFKGKAMAFIVFHVVSFQYENMGALPTLSAEDSF